MTTPAATPSRSLLGHVEAELKRHPPFDRMAGAELASFAQAARATYYSPGETVVQPADGPVTRLVFIRRGSVAGSGFQLEAGEMFPVGALMGARPVTAPYTAVDDLFCYEVDAAVVHRLVEKSTVWADFLNRRVRQMLHWSREAAREQRAAQALAELSFEAPLATLAQRSPLACAPETPLGEALQRMRAQRVGSILALDQAGVAVGILTRHDLLERVVLADVPLDAPLARVMSQPVQTLPLAASVQEAVLVMSRHGIRHLPLTEEGRVVGIVSERDLFALQKRSLRRLSATIAAAPDRDALVAVAHEIRSFARQLLAQGLAARPVTELLSQLNDALTQRAVALVAAARGLDLGEGCWVAFGSEGRSEQTIATDQDNGLVLAPGADRERWREMGHEVNLWLDACGYPLCKGNIMAGNPECCRDADGWRERFVQWMEQGAPEDLLAASIFFDLRPIAGTTALARPLRELITARAAALPRFCKQLADNALRAGPSLNWRGALDPKTEDGREWIDLKLGGTAVFVDAARLFALAQGIDAIPTRERLEAAGRAMNVPPVELTSWIDAFEVLQMLRLRVQLDLPEGAENPNRIDIAPLGSIDRRLLREALRVARALQQRIELDWRR